MAASELGRILSVSRTCPIANWQFWITIAQDVVSGQLYAILEWWEISTKDEDFLASYLLVNDAVPAN